MTDREKRQLESRRRSMRMVVLILQLGLTMLTAIFLCGIIGRILGDRLHNLFLFPLFLLLGILAGFRSCYRMILKFTSLKNPEGGGLAEDYNDWISDFSGGDSCQEEESGGECPGDEGVDADERSAS